MGKIKIWKFDTCHFDLTTKEFLPGTKEFQGGTRQFQGGTNGFQSGTRWWTPGFPILMTVLITAHAQFLADKWWAAFSAMIEL